MDGVRALTNGSKTSLAPLGGRLQNVSKKKFSPKMICALMYVQFFPVSRFAPPNVCAPDLCSQNARFCQDFAVLVTILGRNENYKFN